MKKKEIKKIGYKRIIKQNESHQKVYDDLKNPISANNLTNAKELSQILSKTIIEKFNPLRIIYLVLIVLSLLLRLLGIYVLSQGYNPNYGVLIFAVIFGLGLTLALIILGFVLKSKRITPYKETVIY